MDGMDLDLEIAPRIKGRAAKPVVAVVRRELTPADFVLLQTEKGSKAPPIKRLRHRHHSLARMLAAGMTDSQAAVASGYDISRVSILKGDPTFRELLKFYQENVDAQYADLHERLSGLSIDALEELAARLEEDPNTISSSLLMDMVTKAADRTGYGPSSSSTQVNVNVNLAERLEKARKRVAAKTIDQNGDPA